MRYEEILAKAQQVANDTQCILETKDYSEYGWKSIVLSVDKFGGSAVILCYLINEERCVENIHEKNEKDMDLRTFYRYAKSKVNKMRKRRCTQDLYDFINDQY